MGRLARIVSGLRAKAALSGKGIVTYNVSRVVNLWVGMGLLLQQANGQKVKGRKRSGHEIDEFETRCADTGKMGVWMRLRRLRRTETAEVGRAGGGERRLEEEETEEKEEEIRCKGGDSEERDLLGARNQKGDDLLQVASAGWIVGLGRWESDGDERGKKKRKLQELTD